jgi:RHH-type proline utilization regulon transcriptional repressor/proline dehydrogenase/delta 1-pyrroline-5-carboxylate dehydrogenase
MKLDPVSVPRFEAAFAPDEGAIASRLLGTAPLSAEREARIDRTATRLIDAIRSSDDRLGGVEDMLREFALSTKEGLALMVLAEALLRVPDARTADRFIEDKLGEGDFIHHETKSSAFLVNASAWALGMSARVIQPGETPQGTIGRLAKRLGVPAVRAATRQAMRLMGSHFVLGETIEAALARAHSHGAPRYSFDMLGEGARTAADAERYFNAYASAILAIGASADDDRPLPDRPGISVKLSALHPRFEALSRSRVIRELVPRLVDLARRAKACNLNFTVDAEEADRLELSLEVISSAFADNSLAGWDGCGLAIQAYQKRAAAVIDYVNELATMLDRRMMVRLVKGAYWDTEIKRAQERGLSDYPVFTRKAMTDLNYTACAQRLLALRPRLFPQFATHNALTVATILELADGASGFEFQRLHGMGEALYAQLGEDHPDIACRTYAPVGSHRDLLAYLVRRLLENGANSSFVALAADDSVPVASLLRRPANIIRTAANAGHPNIPLPCDLYEPKRRNSRGIEFGDHAALEQLLAAARASNAPVPATSIIGGGPGRGTSAWQLFSPIDQTTLVGSVIEAAVEDVNAAITAAREGFPTWSRTPAEERSHALERAADLLQQRSGHFIGLLQREGGKTLDDAVSEVREATDFCRYYAAQGRDLFGAGEVMPGPTGESNVLSLRGRGVFVAISPWNFPLAIFLGQVTAALMAGNTVVAKPAEQTPMIAFEAVRLLREAGVPSSALHLLPGDGNIGAALAAHPDVAGVVFTGSTEVARIINRSLAAKDGGIVPLIAETGGINAMIVDATALPEQVADDVVTSAFRSAGQRCSALRLLFVQDDVADRMIEMIAGAAHELAIGDPRDVANQIGPVIDLEAKQRLEAHIARMKREARLHFEGRAPAGNYVAPHIFELASADQLTEEVFGPVLHVVRYAAGGLDGVLQAIERSGYGLTLGIHSRIDDMIEAVVDRLQVGNVYINRNMIGAVVGVQPFGGYGLSGTGPKAGGPHYLPRFATEQTVSVNTAAAGGNAALMSGEQ